MWRSERPALGAASAHKLFYMLWRLFKWMLHVAQIPPWSESLPVRSKCRHHSTYSPALSRQHTISCGPSPLRWLGRVAFFLLAGLLQALHSCQFISAQRAQPCASRLWVFMLPRLLWRAGLVYAPCCLHYSFLAATQVHCGAACIIHS